MSTTYTMKKEKKRLGLWVEELDEIEPAVTGIFIC